MTEDVQPLLPEEVRQLHEDTIEAMPEEQRLAMSREILAAMIRLMAKHRGQEVSRIDSLIAVFSAESEARLKGAKPHVGFFYPIETELPLNAL